MKKIIQNFAFPVFSGLMAVSGVASGEESQTEFEGKDRARSVMVNASHVVHDEVVPSGTVHGVSLAFGKCANEMFGITTCYGFEGRFALAHGSLGDSDNVDYQVAGGYLYSTTTKPILREETGDEIFSTYHKMGVGVKARRWGLDDGDRNCSGGDIYIELGVKKNFTDSVFVTLSHVWEETFDDNCSGALHDSGLEEKQRNRAFSFGIGYEF